MASTKKVAKVTKKKLVPKKPTAKKTTANTTPFPDPPSDKKEKPKPSNGKFSLPRVADGSKSTVFIVKGTFKSKTEGKEIIEQTIYFAGFNDAVSIPGPFVCSNYNDACIVSKDDLPDAIESMRAFLPRVEDFKPVQVAKGDKKAWIENITKWKERIKSTEIAVRNYLSEFHPGGKWTDAEMHILVYLVDCVNRGWAFKSSARVAGIKSYKVKKVENNFYRSYHMAREILTAAGKDLK